MAHKPSKNSRPSPEENAQAQPANQEVISESGAVIEALTRLGPDTPASELKTYLEKMGVHASLATIDEIRREVQKSCRATASAPNTTSASPTEANGELVASKA